MGRDVSDDQPDVAPELGTLNALFRVPGRYPQGDLHDQRRRIAEHVIAEGDQNQGLVPKSGGCSQAAVPRLGTYREEVDDAGSELESCLTALRDSARRPRSASRNGVSSSSL